MGGDDGLVMDRAEVQSRKDLCMADDESILSNPPTPDVAHHVSDYSNFIRLLKWGAVACLVVGLIWMSIVKAYW